MFINTPHPSEVFEATCDKVLGDYGIQLTMGRDFAEFKELVAQARPNHCIQHLFDSDAVSIDPEQAFWLAGTDVTGRPVYLQAMRTLPTKELSLAEYLAKNLKELFPESPTGVDVDRKRYRAGPNAQKMRGRIVYSGEFWIDGSNPMLRGSGLSNVLGRNSYRLAMRAFDPDYVFAFMIHSMAERGTFYRAAFNNAEPLALRWFKKGEANVIELDMLHMSAEEMAFSLQLPIEAAPQERKAA